MNRSAPPRLRSRCTVAIQWLAPAMPRPAPYTMRHFLLTLSALLVPSLASAQALKGVWKPVDLVLSGGANAGSRSDVPGLIIITDNHYSVTLEGVASAGN